MYKHSFLSFFLFYNKLGINTEYHRVPFLPTPIAQHHDISNRTTSWSRCCPSNAVAHPTAKPRAIAPSTCHGWYRLGLLWLNSLNWPPRSTTSTTMTKQKSWRWRRWRQQQRQQRLWQGWWQWWQQWQRWRKWRWQRGQGLHWRCQCNSGGGLSATVQQWRWGQWQRNGNSGVATAEAAVSAATALARWWQH